MKHCLSLSLVFCLLYSCARRPESVNQALDLAGANRAELEKVIRHFEKDPQQLKAVYFLLANMRYHFTYGGEELQQYGYIFNVLDSLHTNKIKVPVTSPIVRGAWDSLVRLHGMPDPADAQQLPDLLSIKADLLIPHITECFRVWKENPWCRNLSFTEFCELLLPYRIAHEQPEPVHARLQKRFGPLRDTTKATRRFDFGAQFNQQVRAFIGLNHTMRLYPFDMSITQMEKARRGSCAHLAQYEAMAMRANGLPVGIDCTPMWGDLDRGHEWNVMLMEDGKYFPFDAGGAGFGGIDSCPYRFSKVFRKTFAAQTENIPGSGDVPPFLVNRLQKDVTADYTKVSDVSVKLTRTAAIQRKYAMICTFKTKTWAPQAYAPIKDSVATFTNMGRNLLYIVMYYYGGNYFPATEPFILDKEGNIRYLQLRPEGQDMLLLRKYPRLQGMFNYMKAMVGGRFEGANRPDFSDAELLYMVKDVPDKVETADALSRKPFRYVRFLSARGVKANVAELAFLDDAGKPLKGQVKGFPEVSQAETGTGLGNVFDGDLETYYNGMKDSVCWMGLDLGRAQSVARIRYCPRSDTNFILDGDEYILRYWDGEKWREAARQKASGQALHFSNIPSGGVYILKNMSRGKEERIFTYENGKQIWW
ncbi:discoidin domain-containing protein [Chitinophaga barathri]|uniref:Peptide-N(4)-(N-acetyl-beta-glucosaminyl)asparagine amidase n=1 Tax=Chitinophaga barathri TaxID=1647451 RepID=A0A3N4M762_9BACT|nr:discoidin domain-containing protein [Chitinophaga barathri]RPD39005.1 hypothetical protein EG028_22980 [Chitinophaga barathri]